MFKLGYTISKHGTMPDNKIVRNGAVRPAPPALLPRKFQKIAHTCLYVLPVFAV